jgi:hypothetical protein
MQNDSGIPLVWHYPIDKLDRYGDRIEDEFIYVRAGNGNYALTPRSYRTARGIALAETGSPSNLRAYWYRFDGRYWRRQTVEPRRSFEAECLGGFTIKPSHRQTCKEWLELYDAIPVRSPSFVEARSQKSHPVVALRHPIERGDIAFICASEREFLEYLRPDDVRPKQWWYAKTSLLVSFLFLPESWAKEK